MTFASANIHQYDEIIALYEATIAALARDGIEIYWDLDFHPSRAFLRRAIEDGTLYIAELDGRVVGAMVVDTNQRPEYGRIAWRCPAKEDEVAVMHVLAISPDCRRGGVASFMLTKVKELCRSRGIRSIRLDALTCNAPACRLYRREGFSVTYAGPILIPEVGVKDFEVFEYVV